MIEPNLNSEVTAESVAIAPVPAGVHLLFVPDYQRAHWLLWGSEAAQSPLAILGEPTSRVIPDEKLCLRRVRGYRLP